MRGGGLLAIATAAAVIAAVSGCCKITTNRRGGGRQAKHQELDPVPVSSDVNLGVAVFPAHASAANAQNYRFRVPPLTPDIYVTGYALTEAEHKGVHDAYWTFADHVGFRRVDEDTFQWRPPPGCEADARCILEAAAVRSLPDLEPLADRFRQRAKAANLNALQVSELIVSFVQAIPYENPKDAPFGLLPPAMVVSERRGDCDSKSLVALMLLHSLGIEGVIVESEAHHHAMLGVPIATPGGHQFTYQGRTFSYTECTATGWPIGQMAPELLNPDDWHPVPVRYKAPPVTSPTKTPTKTRKRRRPRH
jgi:hypothetical protein